MEQLADLEALPHLANVLEAIEDAREVGPVVGVVLPARGDQLRDDGRAVGGDRWPVALCNAREDLGREANVVVRLLARDHLPQQHTERVHVDLARVRVLLKDLGSLAAQVS